MDIKAVLHILGVLLVSIGASLSIPIVVSLIYNENDLQAFILSFLFIIVVGLALWKSTPSDRDIQVREGFGVVTFGWLILAAFGALPFVFSDTGISYTDAFFETMSGFTTTGATVLPDVESLPHGLLFWRSFTHWLGGMGIILLSLAILPMLGVGGMQLFKAEVPGPSVDKLQPRIQDTAKILWAVYVLLSAVETVLLKLGGMSLFDALCHTFATMATGGFSTKNMGIGHFKSTYVEYVLTIFMVLAGTNFALHYRALRGKLDVYHKNPEFRVYLGIVAMVALFLLFSLRVSTYSTYPLSLQKSVFQVASLLTTTGFHSADYEQWPVSAQLILVLLMFIGGCAGSTGGGIKVVRIFIAIKYSLAQLKKLLHPHAVIPIRLGNQAISRDAASDILDFLLLYVLIFALGSFLMTLVGLDLTSSVSTVVSTLGNIGPGIGTVGPTENYAHIPGVGKWLLSLLMLIGRLEIFTVLVIFNRHFWVK
ncbi:MAG: TrkH family potassium uptake protein [bacterium]